MSADAFFLGRQDQAKKPMVVLLHGTQCKKDSEVRLCTRWKETSGNSISKNKVTLPSYESPFMLKGVRE